MSLDSSGMSVSHDDSDDGQKIEVYGDLQYVTANEIEDIAKGKNDPFRRKDDKLKKLNGLTPSLKRKVTREIKKFQSEDGTKSKSKNLKFLTGYAMFDVVEPDYNLDYLAKLYDISAAHHAAVDAKVTNIVGLGFEWHDSVITQEKLSRLDGSESLERARRKVSRVRQLMDEWLEGLNVEDTFEETLKKVWTDYEVTGNGYLEVARKSNGDIGYIGHIASTSIRRRRNKDGYIQIVGNQVTFFRNFNDKETSDPIGGDGNPNEIIHFKKYTPTNGYYGLPDIVAAKNALAGDEFASRFNLDYFEHKAVPRYIITVKGAELSEVAEQRLMSFLGTGLKGQNHRTVYIPLPGDREGQKVEFNMEAVEAGTIDASFLKYREQNRDDMLMVHRTPISKVGLSAGQSLAASRDADKMFREQVCRPMQQIIEKKLRPVFRSKTDIVEFKLTELTLTDEDTQSKIMERYLRWEVLTPNQVLEILGMRGRKDGDKTVGVLAQAKARSPNAREQQTQANQSRTRDARRSAGATDSDGEGRTEQGGGRTTE